MSFKPSFNNLVGDVRELDWEGIVQCVSFFVEIYNMLYYVIYNIII